MIACTFETFRLPVAVGGTMAILLASSALLGASCFVLFDFYFIEGYVSEFQDFCHLRATIEGDMVLPKPGWVFPTAFQLSDF